MFLVHLPQRSWSSASKAESTHATQVGGTHLLHGSSQGCLEKPNFAFSVFLFINITIQMFSKYLLRTSIPLRKSVWKCSNEIAPKGRQALCTYLLSSSNSPEVTYRPQNILFLNNDSLPEVDLHTNTVSHLYGIRQEYFTV